MAHEYSVQIHDWITKKMNTITADLKSATEKNDSSKESYYKGQLGELEFIRQYLTDQIDLDTQKYYQ